ncbi:Hsp20/alpha crystallin family protein [Acidiphilium sp.]|nr:Hsp20/alpha crystallin family protein [Acidiphilium sp.]
MTQINAGAPAKANVSSRRRFLKNRLQERRIAMPSTQVEPRPKAAEPERRPQAAPEFWRPFESLRREVNRLFEDFDGGLLRRALPTSLPFEPFLSRGLGAPAVDIVEQEKAFVITAELPGLTEKDVEIKATDDTLAITGEKRTEQETSEADYQLCERRYGKFERRFSLPAGADASKIEARFANGVLTITLPKRPEAIRAERKIEIKAG